MDYHSPSHIQLQAEPPTLESVDFSQAVISDKEVYTSALSILQKDMLHIQQAYHHQGLRGIIVFQGWDASGKGGAIRRLTEKLDPRGFDVFPIGKPSIEEQGKHYLYRFQTKLPAKGRIVIFDRSWYERVLVERVEALANEQAWQRAYQEINEFERLLMDDGVRIVKLFLHISEAEQLVRLKERLQNPLKHWKLTHEDVRNRLNWQQYELATNDMFRLTSTNAAPWHLVAANKKWYTRIQVLKIVSATLRKGIDITPPPIEQSLVKLMEDLLSNTD